jgi:hypothetical protein
MSACRRAAVIVAALASLPGCASGQGSEAGDAEAFAGTACMTFVEVYVGVQDEGMTFEEGKAKIADARDLAGAAASRDRRYRTLADDLSAMHSAMGVDDAALRAALMDVQADCDPLIPK